MGVWQYTIKRYIKCIIHSFIHSFIHLTYLYFIRLIIQKLLAFQKDLSMFNIQLLVYGLGRHEGEKWWYHIHFWMNCFFSNDAVTPLFCDFYFGLSEVHFHSEAVSLAVCLSVRCCVAHIRRGFNTSVIRWDVRLMFLQHLAL